MRRVLEWINSLSLNVVLLLLVVMLALNAILLTVGLFRIERLIALENVNASHIAAERWLASMNESDGDLKRENEYWWRGAKQWHWEAIEQVTPRPEGVPEPTKSK